MSLADFIMVACGVLALWSIASACEGISDELTRIRELTIALENAHTDGYMEGYNAAKEAA